MKKLFNSIIFKFALMMLVCFLWTSIMILRSVGIIRSDLIRDISIFVTIGIMSCFEIYGIYLICEVKDRDDKIIK